MGGPRNLGRAAQLFVALAIGGSLFGIASLVQADIPDSGVIHGCYGKPGTQQKGQLRVRDASTGEQCRSYENALDWNATGASGPTGPTGPTGPSGVLTNYASETGVVNVPTDVAALTLSTGIYVLSGSVWAMTATSSPNEVRCDLTESGGTASLHAPTRGTAAFLGSAGDTDTMPVVGDITVSSGPTTVRVRCSSQDVTTYQGTLFATEVGGVTAQ
ncbi:MAG TPA: hypothetical protein VLJ76_02550 [Gaiellaceae bacterium]|nr:hypothetical protein [Gaiellaceae bacterium]